MDILSINAEARLMTVAACIGRFPNSWRGWNAMRISFAGREGDMQENGFFCAKSVIDSYLAGVDGRAYHCGQTLHILCKNVPLQILQQAGIQISELSADEGASVGVYSVYDLEAQGGEYACLAEQDCNGAFYHFSTNGILGRAESDAILYKSLEYKVDRALKDLTKVLLVEDDPVTRWMVRNTLKDHCEFAAAPCANKAFSMYSAFNPEVVFLDINLPDGNGYNVLNWIMQNDPGACVVMFSSNNNLDNILGALEQGAQGFVAKPFLRENLMYYIHDQQIMAGE